MCLMLGASYIDAPMFNHVDLWQVGWLVGWLAGWLVGWLLNDFGEKCLINEQK